MAEILTARYLSGTLSVAKIKNRYRFVDGKFLPGPPVVIGLGVVGGIFILDLWIPLGVAVGVLYVFAITIPALKLKQREVLMLTAVCVALILLGFYFSPTSDETWKGVANRALSLFVIGIVTVTLLKWKQLIQSLEAEVKEKEGQFGESVCLNGVLTMCAWCKRINEGDDRWNDIEAYLARQMGVESTGGICPDCLQKAKEEVKHWRGELKIDQPRT